MKKGITRYFNRSHNLVVTVEFYKNEIIVEANEPDSYTICKIGTNEDWEKVVENELCKYPDSPDFESYYQCICCGDFIPETEGIETVNGHWVCNNDSCRTFDNNNRAIEK